MLWLAVWVVLVLAAVALLGWLGYRVFRKALGVLHELGEAAVLLGEAAEQVERLQRADVPHEPAVFADPHELRRSRQRARKRGTRPRRMRTSRAGG